MKKLLFGFVLAFLTLFISSNHFASASMYDEAEKISFDTPVDGMLLLDYDTYDTSVDYYKFTLPADGNVKPSIKSVEDVSWQAKIINSSGKTVSKFETDYEYHASDYSSREVGLAKGTYYIKIEDYFSADGEPYRFKVQYTKGNTFEKELNDSIKTANTIKLNTSYKATVSDINDQDFYKFTLTSNGKVTITMNQDEDYWPVYVLDSAGKKIKELNYLDGNESKQIGLPKGTYYIKVKGAIEDDFPYQFKVGFKSTNFYEKEPNDSTKTATKIELGKKYSGNLVDYDDKDVFKFNVPSNGKVKFTINKIAGASWDVQIKNSSGKTVKTFYTSDLKTSNGKVSVSLNVKKGTYYAVINDEFYTIKQTYEFKIDRVSPNLSSSKVKITNNKGKKDKIVVSGLAKGDIVKVYNASSKGKVLVKATSKGKSVTLSVKQLGKKAGKVYVTVTKSKQLESSRTAVKYKAEKK